MFNILGWYKGKALENVKAIFPLLEESKAQKFWVKGASRKVRAALEKANVANKLAKELEETLTSIKGSGESDLSLGSGWTLKHALYFGQFQRTLDLDLEAIRAAAKTKAQKDAVERAAKWVEDFRPVAELVKALDSARPVPVFTSLGLSPTVTATLKDARLDLDPKTARMCPVRYEWEERIHPETKETIKVPVAILEWPEGTLHNRSRHAFGSKCHACGHAIRNPYNWVPLIMDGKDGKPYSFWVGGDCSSNIFGIKKDGDLEIKGGKQ